MKIMINGEMADLKETISLAEWVQGQEIPLKAVIIEHNGQIVSKDRWADVLLQDGDQLEVIRFVGGG